MAASKYFFSLDAIKPRFENEGGKITEVTSKETPGFVNISFASLRLKKKGAQIEPSWHPNAHKIGYCTEGCGLVSIRSPQAVETFTIETGDVFFIPQGYIHHISNVENKELAIQFACNHSMPDHMYLSKAVRSLSDSVFSATFDMNSAFLEGLKKSKKQEFIKTLPKTKESSSFVANRFKFNIGASVKAVKTKGGYLQLATQTNLPVLEGLGILGFGLNPKGVVEPHWHTNAGELVYIVKGKTLITVLSPDGKVDVMEVNAGQGAFAPASHFHSIENIGSENVEVIAFFNHPQPDYIGVGEVIGSYSNELLSAVFDVSSDFFDKLKKPTSPLVIVPI